MKESVQMLIIICVFSLELKIFLRFERCRDFCRKVTRDKHKNCQLVYVIRCMSERGERGRRERGRREVFTPSPSGANKPQLTHLHGEREQKKKKREREGGGTAT